MMHLRKREGSGKGLKCAVYQAEGLTDDCLFWWHAVQRLQSGWGSSFNVGDRFDVGDQYTESFVCVIIAVETTAVETTAVEATAVEIW